MDAQALSGTVSGLPRQCFEKLFSQDRAWAPDLAEFGVLKQPESRTPPPPPPHHQVQSLSSPKSHTQLSGSGRARKRMLPGHRARPQRAPLDSEDSGVLRGRRVPRARGRRLGQPLPEAASSTTGRLAQDTSLREVLTPLRLPAPTPNPAPTKSSGTRNPTGRLGPGAPGSPS